MRPCLAPRSLAHGVALCRARGPTRDCRFPAPEQRSRFSRLERAAGTRSSRLWRDRGAWRPRGSGRASASALLRRRAPDLVERPLRAAAAACRPRRATRPRREACRWKPEMRAAQRDGGGVSMGPGVVGRGWPLATPETGCLTAVRRPGRDGPQPACRASPRARPACAPATARRPVLRVPRPSLRARRGRPRRG